MKKYKSTKYSDDDLAALIEARRDNSLNSDEGELSVRRQNNLARYMGEEYGDERAGSSKVVTRQCLEAVEWSLPSLMRVFASSNKITEFIPVGPEDETAAKQETDYVNHVFMKENPGFSILYTWIKDALMNPVSYVKSYWEKATEVTTEQYDGLLEHELAYLNQDEELEAVEAEFSPGTDGVPAYNVKFKRTSETGRCVIKPVPAEELAVDEKLETVQLDDADFICHTTYPTRSNLISQGFDKNLIYSLPAADKDDENSERTTRQYYSNGENRSSESNDASTELVEVNEAYLHIDYDRDGVAEYRRILTSGSFVLENDEVDAHPFTAMSTVPMPHTHNGLAWQELVEDIQRVYTTLTRQTLNNLYRANNPRTIVGRGVNLSDVVNDLPNAPIRAKDVDNIRIEPTKSVMAEVLPAFNLFDQMREGRIGVSRTTMGLDADSLSRVTKGAFLGSLEQANQRLELLARILAEYSIKPLFVKIHSILLQHQTSLKTAKISGEWVQVNPSEWKERKDMTVLVGLGTGNKQAQMAALDKVLELQAAIVAQGGMGRLVSEQNIFNSAAKVIEIAELYNAENYFLDPSKQPPQPPQQQQSDDGEDSLAAAQMELAKVEREKAKMKYETEIQGLKLKMMQQQQQHQLEIADLRTDAGMKTRELGQKDRDLSRKEMEMLLNTELQEAQLEQSRQTEIDARQQQAERSFNA